jgi:hypothetical protein
MLGFAFDIYEGTIMQLVTPILIKEWGIVPATMGYITTVSAWVGLIGVFVFPALADLYGRRPILILTILCSSLFTSFTGFAQGPLQLLLFTSVTRIMLRGETPVGMVMVSETAPTRWRATALGGLVGGCVQHPDRGHTFPLVGKIRRVIWRQDLSSHPRLLHQPEPALDVLRRIRKWVARHSSLDRRMRRRGKPVAHELAEILRRVVRVDIADHQASPCSRRKISNEQGKACRHWRASHLCPRMEPGASPSAAQTSAE